MKSSFPFSGFLAIGSLSFLSCALGAQPAVDAAPPVALPKLVEEIRASNPELKYYQDEIAAAKAGVRLAGLQKNPELSLDLGRKRTKDLTGALVGEGSSWSVSVTQSFEWPGRLSLRKAIANRDVSLAELGLARFENALAARARTLAYGLYAANEKAAAVREVAERFAALRETFLARDPAGVAPLLETRVIEAGELVVQRRATEAELALQAALVELNQLRGVPASSPLKVSAGAFAFSEAPTPESLVSAAFEFNFDFRMRKTELEQQGFAVQLARNERYPAIGLRPFVSQDKAGDKETVVGLGLSLPIPVPGRTRSEVEIAKARQRQAQTALLVAERELEREVLVAAQVFAAKVAESRRWSPDSVSRFREAAALADRHYRLGSVPLATYVELQNSYLDAVEALLDTQRETLEAGLKLQQLTGVNLKLKEVTP